MASFDRLINAIKEEDVEEVRNQIHRGVKLNGYWMGRTPLCLAAKGGCVSVVEALLERASRSTRPRVRPNNGYCVVVRAEDRPPPSPDVTTPPGMDRLEWDSELEGGCEVGGTDDQWTRQYAWYAAVLERNYPTGRTSPGDKALPLDVDQQDSTGRTALHHASEYAHLPTMKLLIDAGAKVDVGDVDCVTAIHLAASRGHTGAVELLLSCGAPPDPRTSDRMTPLHYAAARGHPSVVAALASAGANLNALDSTDRTPLKLAAARSRLDVVTLLVERGAKVNLEDNKGYSALCEAVWQKSMPVARVLLSGGARAKPTDHLVQYAVMHRHGAMARLLVEHGALVNARSPMGHTPLSTAALTDQLPMLAFLLNHGAQVNSWDCPPLSAYMASPAGRSIHTVRMLVEAGADVCRAEAHDAPLPLAVVAGKERLAAMLVALGAPLHVKFTHPSYGGSDVFHLTLTLSSLDLVRIICLAGYDLRRVEAARTSKAGAAWLAAWRATPRKLTELCRIVVRRTTPPGGLVSAHLLCLGPLPPSLYDYLLLFDEPLLSEARHPPQLE